MQVGDLITHNPTGAVGTIINDFGDRVEVFWCTGGIFDAETGVTEIIEKLFISDMKKNNLFS